MQRQAYWALLPFLATQAVAQPATDPSADDSASLPVVTVSATKRGQSSRELIGAADVAVAEELGPRGFRKVDDLDRVFTDVNIRQRSNRAYSNLTIRGQSSPDFYNPAAQLYVDGLPQDYALLSQLLPGDLEQVEILYGPQGTLYGRGAVGGVVNIVTRKPDNQLRGSLSSNIGNRDKGASLLLNAPIVQDMLYADVAIDSQNTRGDLHEMQTGERRGNSDDLNGRFRLRYAPTGGPLDVMFTAAHSKRSTDEEYFAVDPSKRSREVLPVPSYYRLSTSSYGLHLNYDLGGYTFSALTGYQDRDFDRTVFGSYPPELQTTFSQELRLATKPGKDRALDYVVGAYYQDIDFQRNVPAYALSSQQNLRSYALYGDATWHASDRLDLTAGLRSEREQAKVDTRLQDTALQRNKSFQSTSPKLGASLRLSEDVSVYGLYSTGFKAGGFTRAVTPQNIAFSYQPQKADNFELGFKALMLNNTLELRAAAYLMRIKDYQLSVGPVEGQYLQNVGDARTRGASIDVDWKASSQLHLKTGLALNSSKLHNYRDPSGSSGTDLSGNTVPYAPKATANLSVEYGIPLAGGGKLTPRMGVSYVGKTYFDMDNRIAQRGYALLDLGVSWKISPQMTADFFVDNATDKTYAVYAFDAASMGLGTAYQLGRGRSLGARLNVRF